MAGRVAISTSVDIFHRVAGRPGWNVNDTLAEIVAEMNREKQLWNDIVKQMYAPFQILQQFYSQKGKVLRDWVRERPLVADEAELTNPKHLTTSDTMKRNQVQLYVSLHMQHTYTVYEFVIVMNTYAVSHDILAFYRQRSCFPENPAAAMSTPRLASETVLG